MYFPAALDVKPLLGWDLWAGLIYDLGVIGNRSWSCFSMWSGHPSLHERGESGGPISGAYYSSRGNKDLLFLLFNTLEL